MRVAQCVLTGRITMKVATLFAVPVGGAILSGCLARGAEPDASEDSLSRSQETSDAPTWAPTKSTTERNFAVRTLYFGDTPRPGTVSRPAWRFIGENLDGKATDGASTDVCKMAEGVPKKAQQDGSEGIDNSFGANILPLLMVAMPNVTEFVNDAIGKGAFTVMFNVKGLSDDAKQSNTGLSGSLSLGGKFGGVPTFTTADKWPVRAEGLSVATDPKSAKARFTGAYVENGRFISGAPTSIPMGLFTSGGAVFDVVVHQATITFDHTAPGKAMNGTIAGVLDTDELIASFKKYAGFFSTRLCSQVALDTIVQQLREASDIVVDGKNERGRDCNGISIGIAFEAWEIGQPSAVEAPHKVAAACSTMN
jgi:hypothetical protein